MSKYDVAIIGAGLGGLISGLLLSKEGKKVIILEKGIHLGGSIQGLTRGGVTFDTGAHYVGGLEKGQNLYRYFDYLGILDDLVVERMDENGFDKIVIAPYDRSYQYAMGYDNFTERMVEKFPDHRGEISRYISEIQDVGKTYPLYSLQYREGRNKSFKIEHFTTSVESFFNDITKSPELQNALGATNLVYAGAKATTPYYIHALVLNSYIQSSYRFLGGASQLAERLKEAIEKNGGEVRTRSEVSKIEFNGRNIERLALLNGEEVYADQFISNVHPSRTLEMIPIDKIRKVYRDRISGLENTYSIFSMYIVLKPGTLNNFNHNVYYFDHKDVWNTAYDKKKWPKSFMVLAQTSEHAQQYADGLTVISPMMFSDVEKWKDTKRGRRPQEYYDFKEEKKEKLLDLMEQYFPQLRNKILRIDTSTPLTYLDYTATNDGSLYGVKRDSRDPLKTNIAPKTKVPNLFFTGQNIDLHGVLGVTVGAVLTCSEILGLDYLLKKISEHGQ